MLIFLSTFFLVLLSIAHERKTLLKFLLRIKTHKYIVLKFLIKIDVNILYDWTQVSLMLYLLNESLPL